MQTNPELKMITNNLKGCLTTMIETFLQLTAAHLQRQSWICICEQLANSSPFHSLTYYSQKNFAHAER